MATTKANLSASFTAGQAFTADHQYCAVKMDSATTATSMQVDLCGAGAAGIGIYQGGVAASGEAVSVVYAGQTKAKAGAAVTVNAYLKSDASGRLVPTTTDTDEVIARALTPASGADEIFEVVMTLGNYAG